MRYLNTCCLLLFAFSLFGQANDYLVNTQRNTFRSTILDRDKSYQVFLPESYNYSDKGTYPVVYIVDGDYNFYYQTGIIESLANVSEKTPELIVVAISDNGNEGYKQNCTLKSTGNPKGNAENFMAYIKKELKPEIEKKYRVASYDILIGHSLGGLLASTLFLKDPDSFDAYIAIDPSYWWDDYAMVGIADSLLKGKEELTSKFFVTLADTKQMGVHQFVAVLEKHLPDSKKWTFKYYEDENHGSVGLVSVKDGLLKIFENWELKREQFYELKTASKVLDHYKKLSEEYDANLRIPPFIFGSIVYYYFSKEQKEELAILEKEINLHFPSSSDDFYSNLGNYLMGVEKFAEAQEVLERSVNKNPKSYKSYDILSKLFFAREDFQKSIEFSERSIAIAKDLKVRRWQLNELESNHRKIMIKAEKDK